MAELDITATTTTDMTTLVDSYKVQQKATEGPSNISDENYYDNTNFTQYYGLYKKLPQLKKTIDAFATWVLGKGYSASARDTAVLENLTGAGDEDFLAILWNLKVTAKINGDAYAEVIRNDDGILLNLKPLSPQNMRIVYNKKGVITHYVDKRKPSRKISTQDIFHLVNDRVADEMGGTSVVPVVKWAIEAKNEALEDKRRSLHLSTIRVIEVEEDDTNRLSELKRDYKEAIKNGNVLLLPKGTGGIQDFTSPNSEHLEWIRYLDNFIYIAVGVPKVIMGSVDSIPESGGKISYLTYEQIYSRETRELEADIWNQLAIRIKFNPPASIAEGVADERSTAQTGFQPSDTKI